MLARSTPTRLAREGYARFFSFADMVTMQPQKRNCLSKSEEKVNVFETSTAHRVLVQEVSFIAPVTNNGIKYKMHNGWAQQPPPYKDNVSL